METFEEPTLAGFEDELPCSAQAYPASRLPLPGSEEGKKMTVGSGRQCSMLLDQSSPLGYCSKILLESSHWTNSLEYCYVWNRLDTKFGCSAFRLMPLGQSTDESESLLLGTVTCIEGGPNAHTQGVKQTLNRLWRTPNTFDHLEPKTQAALNHEVQTTHAGSEPNNLRDQAAVRMGLRLWPTPRAEHASGKHNGKADTLHSAAKLWPTPQAHDSHQGDPERVGRFGTKHGGRNLTDEVMNPKLWPTPRAEKRASLESHGNYVVSGSLNPRFVEELMGFPIDHTACGHWAMQSSRSRRTRSSRRSQKLYK